MGQHIGDLIVTDSMEIGDQVTGTTYVEPGGKLVAHGQLAGGLVIEAGAEAVVHGQICRNVLNHGRLTIYGQIVGKILGDGYTEATPESHIIGDDLPL